MIILYGTVVVSLVALSNPPPFVTHWARDVWGLKFLFNDYSFLDIHLLVNSTLRPSNHHIMIMKALSRCSFLKTTLARISMLCDGYRNASYEWSIFSLKCKPQSENYWFQCDFTGSLDHLRCSPTRLEETLSRRILGEYLVSSTANADDGMHLTSGMMGWLS